MARIAPSLAHCWSCANMAAHMSSVNALSALGRLSVMRPSAPSRRNRTLELSQHSRLHTANQLYYCSDNARRKIQMRTVGAREANQQFSRLLKEAESGREITITRNGQPVARLGPARRPLSTSA